MRRCLLLLVVVIQAAPASAQAPAKTPEELLPKDCLFFFRYDGYEPHKKAYDQTTLAKIMEEDLGDFLAALGEYLFKQIEFSIKDGAGEGDFAARLEAQGKKFLDYLWKHGVAVGFQSPRNVAPALARWNLTLVFPEGARKENQDA